MADVEKMKNIIPVVTCGELMFDIDVSNLNFGIKINSVKQPIQSNSVGSWHMSHGGTSTFDYHLDHGFMVLNDT